MNKFNSTSGVAVIPIILISLFLVVASSGAYLGFKEFSAYKVKDVAEKDELRHLATELQQRIDKQQKSITETKQELAKEVARAASQIQLTNQQIIKLIKPATVFIQTSKSSGSGITIDSDGYILTNNHVVDGSYSAKVKLADGGQFDAVVISRDVKLDLAVIKIGASRLPRVTFGDSDKVNVGEEVFTLGYPFGLEGDVSFKEGTISRRFTYGDLVYLETSAEIHPGNSGGPLVNKYGEVVGVNSAAYGSSVNGVSVGETIKFAIPINVARSIIASSKTVKIPSSDEVAYHEAVVDLKRKAQELLSRSIQAISVAENNISFSKSLLLSIDYYESLGYRLGSTRSAINQYIGESMFNLNSLKDLKVFIQGGASSLDRPGLSIVETRREWEIREVALNIYFDGEAGTADYLSRVSNALQKF